MSMGIKYSIFFSISLALVPMVYASSAIPDACAAIRDPKFDTGACEWKNGKQTCCWYQKSYPGQFGRGDKYCQTCSYYHDANGEAYEKCTDPKKQEIKLPQGDLPQLQSTDNKTGNSLAPNSELLRNGGSIPQLETTYNDSNTAIPQIPPDARLQKGNPP